jgi:hypothetical protein
VIKENKSFLLDMDGNIVSSGDYSYINITSNGTLTATKSENNMFVCAILDKGENVLTGFKDFTLYHLNENLLLGLRSGILPGTTPPHDYNQRIALIDINGNNLSGFKYSNHGDFLNNYFIVNEQYYGTAGLLNQYGAEVLPTVFEEIMLTNEGEGYVYVVIKDPDTGNSRAGYFKIPEGFKEKKRIPPVTVYLNGIELYFDVEPTIVNSRTMVPMRKIFETLGADVLWDENERKVKAVRGDATVELTVGKTTALINGETVILDVPAVVQSDRTLVPLRFVAEALECEVDWENDLRWVLILENEKEKMEVDEKWIIF